MAADASGEVPEGAAVFPPIPPELGINPLLLAAVHATIFLAGSDDEIVHPDAADEAVQAIAGYFQRLDGKALARVREDMATLAGFARREKWPRQMVHALQSFLADLGIP